jgi:hypothetical protein
MKVKLERATLRLKRLFIYLALFAAPLLVLATAKSMAARPAIVVEMLDTPPV